MIYFDHCYTPDQNHRFLKRLESLGFIFNPETVEHPGKAFCRFLMFPCAEISGRKAQYLEFVHCEGKGYRTPGLLLGYSGSLKRFAKKLAPVLDVDFFHKNYDWKENSKDALPGWNFLTFKNLGFRTLNAYFIQYEKGPKRHKRPAPKHPNGVESLYAVEFEIEKRGRSYFKKIFGSRWNEKIKVRNSFFFFKKGKRTDIRRVILKSKNIDKFIASYDIDREIVWNGRRAALISNPSGKWDIVII
jgi:hypothetical protein